MIYSKLLLRIVDIKW